ncbi:MAG: tryptophan 7-halogenase [Myxococcales bacterium]|nr:tryptophan 7-halogenase [Myxococcales bacterium]MCB9705581.1 tryptophan 7-halogenase [Myxococcales bacterium]
MEPTREVVIIGCGPAGSTAANLLAAAGRDVVVVEREVFPRFHVGESLLPCELPLFARLGVEIDGRQFQYKQGAEFIDERSGDRVFFSFAEGLAGTPTHAWQVERAIFDHLLADAAAARGAEIRYGEEVVAAEVSGEHVDVRTDRGSIRARYVIDASGQAAVLARLWRSVEPIREMGRAAVFGHFFGLSPEVQEELGALGNVKIFLIEDGWLWAIPLVGGRLSVGVIKWRGKIDEALHEREVAASPILRRLTAGAERTPLRLLSNFSFRNQRSHGPRHVCVGDASCFLDPIFSSGISLAMLGAEKAVDLLIPALVAGDEGRAELMAPHADHMRIAYESFEQLIRRFYHSRMIHNLFFAAEPDPSLRRGLISILAGDVWRDDNPFQAILAGSGRRRQSAAG